MSVGTLSEAFETLSTGVVDSTLLSFTEVTEQRRAWEKIIDHKLLEWALNPSQFDQDEIDPPTETALLQTSQWCFTLRDAEMPPPRWFAPDGIGGISMGWGTPGVGTSTIEIHNDGTVELIRTEQLVITQRQAL